MANLIRFKKNTSAPNSGTAAKIGEPLFHYSSDGSGTITNLFMGYADGDNSVRHVGARIDDDTALAGNSDDRLVTQAAIKAYVDAQVDTADAISELADVTIASSAANELLFTTGANTWVNYTLAEAGIQPLDAQLTTLAGYTAAQVTRGISDGNLLTANDVVVDNDFLRINGTEVEGRSASEVLSDIGVTAGISDGNYLTANDVVVDNDFLRINGTEVEGRSAAEVLSDLSITKGISDGNILSANDVVVDDDFLRINGTEVEGRSASETLADIGVVAGIGNTQYLTCNSAVADDDFIRVTGTVCEGRSAAETLSDIGAAAVAGSSSQNFAANGLTVAGDLVVTGDTTTNEVLTVSTSNGVQFEGASLDGHDAILKSVVAGADVSYTLPNVSGYVALFATDPSTTAIVPTVAELNYVDGVTSAIQTQLDAKQATITGSATTIDTESLTASRAVISNGSSKIAVSATTSAELAYVNGVTSAIQTQLNAKQATITGSATTIDTESLTASRALVSNASQKVAVATTTLAELNYVNGVTSAIQTQIDSKSPTAGSSSLTTLGTIGSVAAPIGPVFGGTGVAQASASSTLTISGAYATTLTVSGTTGVTLPQSGTILSDGSEISGGTYTTGGG